MINFDSLSLKAFIIENQDFITGAVIKKIQQPSRREILLTLRNNGENKKFYININPEFFHVCFIDDLKSRGSIVPDAVPMFCMLLRKYIQNAKIRKVIQPFGERIIEFHFEYKDVLEDIQKICLSVELMGKYSNIILYNVNTGIIIGCAHNVGEEKSKNRELAGTLPYIYPEKQNKKDLLNTDYKTFTENLPENFDELSLAFTISNEYFYITIPMVKQCIQALNIKNINQKDLEKVYLKLKETISLNNINPSVNQDFSEFSLVNNLPFDKCISVNQMINKYFQNNQINKLLKQRKARLYTHIDLKIKKLNKQLEYFKLKTQEKEKSDTYRLKGDILMMNTNAEIKPIVTLQNLYNNQNIEIELDTQFSIIQNANRYYKLYKKTKTAYEYALSQINDTENQLKNLEEQKFYIDISSNLDEIEEITTELNLNVKEEKTAVKKQKPHQYNLEYHEIEGFKVYLGKNSSQNDYLLSKVASPEDIWFHPQNMHGAHVILKRNKMNVPNSVMLACAKLAKRFSKAQNDALIPIIYTERKYVKKANSKIAFVTYKNEKEIFC